MVNLEIYNRKKKKYISVLLILKIWHEGIHKLFCNFTYIHIGLFILNIIVQYKSFLFIASYRYIIIMSRFLHIYFIWNVYFC